MTSIPDPTNLIKQATPALVCLVSEPKILGLGHQMMVVKLKKNLLNNDDVMTSF